MQHHLFWTSVIVSSIGVIVGLIGVLATAVFTFRQRKQLVRAEKRWLANKLHHHEVKAEPRHVAPEEQHAELVL